MHYFETIKLKVYLLLEKLDELNNLSFLSVLIIVIDCCFKT